MDCAQSEAEAAELQKEKELFQMKMNEKEKFWTSKLKLNIHRLYIVLDKCKVIEMENQFLKQKLYQMGLKDDDLKVNKVYIRTIIT